MAKESPKTTPTRSTRSQTSADNGSPTKKTSPENGQPSSRRTSPRNRNGLTEVLRPTTNDNKIEKWKPTGRWRSVASGADPTSLGRRHPGNLDLERRRASVIGAGSFKSASGVTQSPTPQGEGNRPLSAGSWFDKDIPDYQKREDYTDAIDHHTCKRTAKKIGDFLKGEIVWAPYHVPNTETDFKDNEVERTCAGPVFSKRRPFVILWKSYEDLFAVPLYTHKGEGINKVKKEKRPEYICVKNVGDSGCNTHGANCKPLEAKVYACQERKLHPMACCHITGGIKIYCRVPMTYFGRLTPRSYELLLNEYKKHTQKARDKRWEGDRPPPGSNTFRIYS